MTDLGIEHKLGGYKIYTREDAAALFAGRKLVIWGAGEKGRGFEAALRRNDLKVSAFMDRALAGSEVQGIPVLDPATMLSDRKTLADFYFLCATIRRKYLEMFATLQAAGLTKERDYTNIQTLCPYYPTVEISGLCQLHCIACPRNGQNAHGGLMTTARFIAILDKLIREIPFLYLVESYYFGDPLLNQHLPDMVRAGRERGVQLGISTNLNFGQGIDTLCAAAPAKVHVAISGFGQNYEVTHKGGRWRIVEENMRKLAVSVEKFGRQTRVALMFHVHRNNVVEIPSVQQFCRELGFDFSPIYSQVFPDLVLDRLEGKPESDDAKLAIDLMLVPMDECLAKARADTDKVCTNKRCLPVIDWDGSVLPCCNFAHKRIGGEIRKGEGSKISGDFLKVSLSEIVERRQQCDLCQTCIAQSLHRYFNAADSQSIVGPILCT